MRKKVTILLGEEDLVIKEMIQQLIKTPSHRFFKRSESFVAMELLRDPLVLECESVKTTSPESTES